MFPLKANDLSLVGWNVAREKDWLNKFALRTVCRYQGTSMTPECTDSCHRLAHTVPQMMWRHKVGRALTTPSYSAFGEGLNRGCVPLPFNALTGNDVQENVGKLIKRVSVYTCIWYIIYFIFLYYILYDIYLYICMYVYVIYIYIYIVYIYIDYIFMLYIYICILLYFIIFLFYYIILCFIILY